MKKFLIAAIVIVIAGVGVMYYLQSQKPEKQIIGQWTGTYEIGSFDFRDDGTVTVGFASLSAEGEYTVDSENSVLSIKYSLLGVSYTKKYDFILEKNRLTLTDQLFAGYKLYYNKADQ